MSFNREFLKRINKAPDEKIDSECIDMHIHYVDFLQQSDGMKSLIGRMDQSNVKKCVIFGLPVKKKWDAIEPERPQTYLDDEAKCYYYPLADELLAQQYLHLDAKSRKRIAPTICSFNPTDCTAVDYVRFMLEKYDFWKGIGELLLRHDDLTNLTMEETARVNHPALNEIFRLCEDENIPLNIHQNSTSVGHNDRFEYLHELESVLQIYDATFVWAHCGASRRVTHKDYAAMVKGMLDRYDNLYVDISWVVYDDIICENLEPKKSWVELIENNSERFMIGSDLCGHYEKLAKTLARYNGLIRKLSPEGASNVLFRNAEKIWFKD
jgi:hypothetical protein